MHILRRARVSALLLLWFLLLSTVATALHQPQTAMRSQSRGSITWASKKSNIRRQVIISGDKQDAEIVFTASPSKEQLVDSTVLILPERSHTVLGGTNVFQRRAFLRMKTKAALGIVLVAVILLPVGVCLCCILDGRRYKEFLARIGSLPYGRIDSGQRNEKGRTSAEQARSPRSQTVFRQDKPNVSSQADVDGPYQSYGRDARGSLGSSLLTSSNASPFATDTRLSLGHSSVGRLQLPSPLTAYTGGEAFCITGAITPYAQEKKRIDIVRFIGNEVVARVHVAEDRQGCGMLLEFVPCDADGRPQPFGKSVPFAFLDTSEAVVASSQDVQAFAQDKNTSSFRGSPERSKHLPNRHVAVLGCTEAGWDATATPTAIVKESQSGDSFIMSTNGEELLRIQKSNNMLDRVESMDRCLLATIPRDGSSNAPRKMSSRGSVTTQLTNVHCSSGSDAGLILCAIVACMKLLRAR